MEFFEKIKTIRSLLGLNQREFSKKLNIKQSYYSEMESGKKPVSKKVLKKLTEDVGVSEGWLLRSKGDIFSDNVWADVVGSDVVYKRNEGFELIQQRRLLNELLKGENPNSILYKNLSQLIGFHFVLSDIHDRYLSKIMKAELNTRLYVSNGKFNYEEYKASVLKVLSEFESIREPLAEFSAAISDFCAKFKEFDKYDIIEPYYIELKQVKE